MTAAAEKKSCFMTALPVVLDLSRKHETVGQKWNQKPAICVFVQRRANERVTNV